VYRRRETLNALEKRLGANFTGRAPFVTSACRIAAQIDWIDQAILSCRIQSPSRWAVHMRTLAIALNMLSSAKNKQHLETISKLLCVTGGRATRLLGVCLARCVDRIRDYRKRGIDPQCAITVTPHLEAAKRAVAKWKIAAARIERVA
jgi:hypothetical protein